MSTRVLLAIALIAAPISLRAQDSTPVVQPDVRVEDRWLYRRTDLLTNKIQFDYETKVAFVGPDVILTTGRRLGTQDVRDENYTREWNARTTGAGFVFNTVRRFLKFPLTVGDSFDVKYELLGVRGGSNVQAKYDQKVTVFGWENLTVPAGKFRAIRVEAKGAYWRLDKLATGELTITQWYVPAVKRWVKWSWDDDWLKITDELVDFQVH